MNFMNLVDLVQVFANEYCRVSNTILLIGNQTETKLFKEIFKFINSELIVIDNLPHPDVDITFTNEFFLPFLNFSFDLILNFLDFSEKETNRVLKSDGKILTKVNKKVNEVNKVSFANVGSDYFKIN